jgi:hypothetical protein
MEKGEGMYRWQDIEAHDLDIAVSAEACLVTRYFLHQQACRQTSDDSGDLLVKQADAKDPRIPSSSRSSLFVTAICTSFHR